LNNLAACMIRMKIVSPHDADSKVPTESTKCVDTKLSSEPVLA